MSRILVVHAGRNGDTRQVAEAIATAATAAGATARVAPADTVCGPLRGWDLVVLGVPLQRGRWKREAHRFLDRHRDGLETVPVAVYGIASTDADDVWAHSRIGLDRALERHTWFVPVAVGLFNAARPQSLPSFPTGPRDWTAIGDWARKLVALVSQD